MWMYGQVKDKVFPNLSKAGEDLAYVLVFDF